MEINMHKISIPREARGIYVDPAGNAHYPGETFSLSDEHRNAIHSRFFDNGHFIEGDLPEPEERDPEAEREATAAKEREIWLYHNHINGVEDPDAPILYGFDADEDQVWVDEQAIIAEEQARRRDPTRNPAMNSGPVKANEGDEIYDPEAPVDEEEATGEKPAQPRKPAPRKTPRKAPQRAPKVTESETEALG